MSARPRRLSFDGDNPLAPGPAPTPGPTPPALPRPTAKQPTPNDPKPDTTAPATATSDETRGWSGDVSPQTYRVPRELHAALKDRAADQAMPIGMIVTAAISAAMDLPDRDLQRLVTNAEGALREARRAAARR